MTVISSEIMNFSRWTKDYSIRKFTEHEFSELRDKWELLLSGSEQDRLFMGWNWQYLWWKQWSKVLNNELILLGVYNNCGDLVGIAPLYICTVKVLPFLRFRQLHFIGCSRAIVDSVRTEYLDFILNKNCQKEVREILLYYLNSSCEWDQMFISDIRADSETTRNIEENKILNHCSIRKVFVDRTTFIPTDGDFITYSTGLGKQTRYKAINRSKYLFGVHGYNIEYADESTIEVYFQQMNELHRKRWGTSCFSGCSLDFHTELARLSCTEGNLVFSRISVNNRPISFLYNLRAGNREYNIQSAFDENYKKNYSLGLVHLGLSIKAAFNNRAITELDLLAGTGKHEYYKSHLGNEGHVLFSLQIIRNAWLSMLYGVYDVLPAKLKILYSYCRSLGLN